MNSISNFIGRARMRKGAGHGLFLGACATLFAGCGSPEALAENQPPALGLDSVLNTDIYDSGFMGLVDYDLVFAPAGPVSASVVMTSGGKDIQKFGFFPDYKYTATVFGKLQPENHAEHTFAPGDYAMDFYVADKLATRVPFSVKAGTASDDPFNPQSTVKFIGPWQTFAYFTFQPNKDIQSVSVSFWAGASDLPAGETRGPVLVKLTRGGKLVAHSKRNQGMLDHNLLRRHTMLLFQPHETKGEANAILFSKSDAEQNGKYKLTVELTNTGEIIREYAFSAAGGKLKPHPRTAMGHKPAHDYIAPRVLKQGTTSYEFVEAYWMAAP